MLEHAFAGRGLRVLPLEVGDEVPLVPKAAGGNGGHDATADPARIEVWWSRCPAAERPPASTARVPVRLVESSGTSSGEQVALAEPGLAHERRRPTGGRP